ncbi:MauE/DoxX family redox-associated membrane protein [Nonomuraea sp. NPDC048916]|uniref:MauE/DoxX family redox-associated membrane protein n=1 Tax=Nonomuraea sp. NPDC048916 TaxID=3154232 RepID=UPI003404CCED
MSAISLLVALAASGALLWAGLEKLRTPSAFTATLMALSIPSPLAWIGAVAIPCAELVVGGALIVVPGAVWPGFGVAALGVLFAGAGLLGLRAERPVPCACLGATGHSTLGWRQILLLPAWVGAAIVVTWSPQTWEWQVGLEYLAGLIIALAAVRGVVVAGSWRAATGDRQAMQEAAAQPMPMFNGSGSNG